VTTAQMSMESYDARSMTPMTRVVVAAGPAMVCDAYAARIATEDGLHAAGSPGDLNVCVRGAMALSPDVVVVDVATASGSEEALVQHMRELPSAPAVVALVPPGDIQGAVLALEAGAIAVVLKNAPSSELVTAVKGAASGVGWISPPLLRGVLSSFKASIAGGPGNELSQLTSRELEILQLLVDGLGRREIASSLYLSIETIRTHMCTIMNKLDVHSAIAAAAVGRKAGLRPTRHRNST
jgi:DNA-binding NarL/FixJ family response regulator